MDPTLSVSYKTVSRFFEAAQGNYRNAMYISCNCSYRRESGCGDFLYIPGHDCRPVLLPLTDAENFLCTRIDKTDCAAVISSSCFIRLYHQWLMLSTSSSTDCPIQQLLHMLNTPENGK